jgi:hypothetical protein
MRSLAWAWRQNTACDADAQPQPRSEGACDVPTDPGRRR